MTINNQLTPVTISFQSPEVVSNKLPTFNPDAVSRWWHYCSECHRKMDIKYRKQFKDGQYEFVYDHNKVICFLTCLFSGPDY